MFIALEGIDGVGKSTAFENLKTLDCGRSLTFITKKQLYTEDEFLRSLSGNLSKAIWPNGDGKEHWKCGQMYWLYAGLAWFHLISSEYARLKIERHILIDHWYYRLIAKFAGKGLDVKALLALFAQCEQPDLVFLLDADPSRLFGRRAFKLPEMGSLDNYQSPGFDSYREYQSKIRAVLLLFANELNWNIISDCDEKTPEHIAKEISEVIDSRLADEAR